MQHKIILAGLGNNLSLIESLVKARKFNLTVEVRDGLDGVAIDPLAKIVIANSNLKGFGDIRKNRKNIYLCGLLESNKKPLDMYLGGLDLLKEKHANLAIVDDSRGKISMVVCPEEAVYHEAKGDSRLEETLNGFIDIIYHRSHLQFTQSIVIEGKPVDWNSHLIPSVLREVVNFCVKGDAYKPYKGSTVGHFAAKLDNQNFLTSIRKSNFNKLDETGLVWVRTDGPDTVLAYGAKPSVGGQSQRIVFREHDGMDCIVHFHSPLKSNHKDNIPIVSQREVECGSHECGKNTSQGLRQFGNIKAVMLDQHGPNIVFSKLADPKEVIEFIKNNFDLTKKTGGYQLPK